MGGTDLMDQGISYFKFERRTRRWTLKSAMYLIEVMLNNAFITYQMTNQRLNRQQYILECIDIMLGKDEICNSSI